jgi:hypothetical protein
MLFPSDLERDAFRSRNDEFGWTRAQVPTVVEILRSNKMAILGGELWWARDGTTDWDGLIPQRVGPPAVYPWETKRESDEPWSNFVERGASEALAAAERWPGPNELPPDLPGQILYNLTWVSDAEFNALGSKT